VHIIEMKQYMLFVAQYIISMLIYVFVSYPRQYGKPADLLQKLNYAKHSL
jgi:hypothetical protein